jgi:ankyrin repeat protein
MFQRDFNFFGGYMRFLFAVFLIFLGVQVLGTEQKTAFSAISQNDVYSLKKILKQNPELIEKNDKQQTILHVAVLSNNFKVVKVILESGFSHINQLDKYGKTAMDYAVECKYKKILRKLYKYKGCVTSYENEQKVQKNLLSRYKIIFHIGKALSLAIIAVVVITFAIGLCINNIELCWAAGIMGCCCVPVFAASLILTAIGILGSNNALNEFKKDMNCFNVIKSNMIGYSKSF